MNPKTEALKPGEQSALENMADGRLRLLREALIGANGIPASLITDAVPAIAEGLAFAYEGMLIDAIKEATGKTTSKTLLNTSAEVQASLMTQSDVTNLTDYLTRERMAIEVFISAGIPDDSFLMQLITYRAAIFKAKYEEVLNSRINTIFRDKSKRVMPNATIHVQRPTITIPPASEMNPTDSKAVKPEQAAAAEEPATAESAMTAHAGGSATAVQTEQTDSKGTDNKPTGVDRFLATQPK